MIWIWKGRGWVIAILLLLAPAFSMPCADAFVTMANYSNETAIQIGLTLIYAGVFIRTFFLLFPAKAARHFIDSETGKDVFLTHVDSLYYLDVKYWAYGFLGIGIVMFVVSFSMALLG